MKRFILFFLLSFSINSFSQKQIPSIDLYDFQREKINTSDLLNNENILSIGCLYVYISLKGNFFLSKLEVLT